jgi:hypothetical protein
MAVHFLSRCPRLTPGAPERSGCWLQNEYHFVIDIPFPLILRPTMATRRSLRALCPYLARFTAMIALLSRFG